MAGFDNLGMPGILARLAANQNVTAQPPQPKQDANSYATGGMVGPGGSAIRPGVQPQQGGMPQGGQQSPGPMAETEIRNTLAQNPQVAQQIQAQAQQLIASGELTPQEIETAVKLAKLALRDPKMWPQIRQFAIQQGLATEQEIPMQYDEGLLFIIIALGEAMQGGQSAMASMPGQPQQAMASMPPQGQGMPQQGAPGPQGQGGGPVDIKAHEGEYIIPKHVVGMKGKEFFDNLVGKYDPAQQ